MFSPECYTKFWKMTIYSDTLHWSGTTPIFDPITDLDLITEFDFFFLIARGFHRTFATDAAYQQRSLTPPDTWSCPTLGLASVLLGPISPEVVFFPVWVSNIPRYFCFAYYILAHFRQPESFVSTFDKIWQFATSRYAPWSPFKPT